MERRKELELNLDEVRQAIAAHTERDVSLIVVTKTWPASDVSLLYGLGVTDVGENRDQEAGPKHDEVGIADLTWHCIGQLQTNKVKSVASWADVVHSVDRPKLVQALALATTSRPTPLKVLIQVNLDQQIDDQADADSVRGGAAPSQVAHLASAIAKIPTLELAGVMGVGPLGQDPEPAFQRLQAISHELIREHPNATWISAGMSQDFQVAVNYGATHLRIGSNVLGHRS